MQAPRLIRHHLLAVAAVALAACRDEPPTAPTTAGPPEETVAAATTLAFVQVTQGITHSCGVTADDRAYCWGDNYFGQLGDGTTITRTRPRAVAGGLRFQAVSAGIHFTCGLTTEDRAYCWGDNLYGTLGDGNTNEASSPVPVAVAGTRRYRQLKAGEDHVCAVTLADVTFCWGSNGNGQLGVVLTGFQQSYVPLKVGTGGVAFRRVYAGGSHTCALTAEGVAYCWGNNRDGQLGDGTRDTTVVPVRVSGSRTWSQLSTGTSHTCGVSNAKAYCWGSNLSGGLGDGTTVARTTPTAVSGGLSFKGVSASFLYTCGITSTNKAYCWGHNSFGQLGDGTFGYRNYRLVPTKVLGGYSFKAIGGMTVSAHTCAVTPDDRAYCWGDNSRAQLGNGTWSKSSRPVPVG